jgi:DNA modification methylase
MAKTFLLCSLLACSACLTASAWSLLRPDNSVSSSNVSRGYFLSNAVHIAAASIVGVSLPAYSAEPALPFPGEIESAIPSDSTEVDNPLSGDAKSQFSRLDSTPDSRFYSEPRFVEHVDDNAVRIMTNYIGDVVGKEDVVLDLCSSWTSHLNVQPKAVVGLGMNEKELSANPSLTSWNVQDLNENPRLPYPEDAFSVVLCQLSIDYLTQPFEVLKEVGRVLQPGGTVHILFSNRLFLSKVSW